MKKTLQTLFMGLSVSLCLQTETKAQINLLQDYVNTSSPMIGTFQGINFREAGFSALYPIAGTNGKEFWTCSDRGVNVDAANANPSTCRPTYDKIYGFASYAPKIHRVRINGTELQILQTISMKRPNGTNASGIINPTGLGSTAAELASTDTVLNCLNFSAKIAAKDTFGIDSEGLVVDKDGNFWICEEGGPTVWKLNKNGVVIKRFTPYANLAGAQSVDVQIDTVFKYRKNNRGFEGISITPNGKIYAIIQSPILYPNKSIGEGTRIHRILEIDPTTNATRMFAYLNDGIIGASGSNQIRLRDWKIGDMAAINNTEFLVLEAALRGTTDIKRMYKIDISGATPVTSGLYGTKTLEALVDAAGLSANGIVPVTKTLFMDLLANGWPSALEKAEGLAIINDSTIAIGNDNDYGQLSAGENGVATASGIQSHIITFGLKGLDKISNYVATSPLLSQGLTGPSTLQTPYVLPSIPGAKVTSILTAGETINGYKMAGIPDGSGAYDNGDGTFTFLVNHEIPATNGAVRAHGSKGAFVSKWIINKSDLSVVNGSDLIQKVNIWDKDSAKYDQITTAFGRFCSADLAKSSAFFNAATGLGTQERIFLNGEENGADGRAFAHILTGANAGTTYELPYLGKFSWENAVANPFASNKTIVAGTDDTTPGQVYMYIGTKDSSGTEIQKAGLNNGKLFGVAVNGLINEVSATYPAANTTFNLIDLGQVQNLTGAQLNANSNAAGVTNFLRPEDGAWDPSNLSDFYFVTTNGFTAPSRLWRLRFADITNPELGGTITALLDGTEGQKMLDNLTIDNYGHVLMQEDVGNNVHIGKIWQYTIATDALVQIAKHDENRFIAGGSNFLTQDEEGSGIIDVQDILGQGHFLMVDQAHYSLPGEVYEGGQLLSFFNPDTYNAAPNSFAVTGGGIYCYGDSGKQVTLTKSEIGVNYQLLINSNVMVSSASGNGNAITFNNLKAGVYTILGTNANTGVSSLMKDSVVIIENPQVFVNAGANQMVFDGYSPQDCTTLTANVTGGTPSYRVMWSTNDSTKTINVCPKTNTVYNILVADAYGCTAYDNVKVCVQNVVCGSYCSFATITINGKKTTKLVKGKKIRICHKGSSICVNDNAVAAHLAHGDYLGTCNANTCNEESLTRTSQNVESTVAEGLIQSEFMTRIYPNPASTSSSVILNVEAPQNTNVYALMYNVNGQIIKTLLNETITELNEYLELQINTSDLAAGVYFIKTTTSNGDVKMDKLIITN